MFFGQNVGRLLYTFDNKMADKQRFSIHKYFIVLRQMKKWDGKFRKRWVRRHYVCTTVSLFHCRMRNITMRKVQFESSNGCPRTRCCKPFTLQSNAESEISLEVCSYYDDARQENPAEVDPREMIVDVS